MSLIKYLKRRLNLIDYAAILGLSKEYRLLVWFTQHMRVIKWMTGTYQKTYTFVYQTTIRVRYYSLLKAFSREGPSNTCFVYVSTHYFLKGISSVFIYVYIMCLRLSIFFNLKMESVYVYRYRQIYCCLQFLRIANLQY